MAGERVVDVVIPIVPETGGGKGVGVVASMAALFGVVVVFAVLVLVAVVVMFRGTDYSTVPATRELGPCEPFCSLRTTAPAPTGGVR
jgi:hypothetical protein